MNILVLGGTGFIGAPAVRLLAEAGHRVAVFSRGRRGADLPAGAVSIAGDYQHLADSAAEFRRFAPESVIDMIPLTAADAERVVETFRGLARRLVVISSQDVYLAWGCVTGTDPGPVDPHVTEDSPLRRSRYPYRGRPLPAAYEWDLENYDKILVEQVFQSEPALPASILRLPMVYGPGDPVNRIYPYLRRMDDGRPMVPIERNAARWRGPLGYVEDVASAIALAATLPAATGRVYNVAEADLRPLADFVAEIGAAAGWNGSVVELPPGAIPGPWDAFHLSHHVLTDSSRIRAELGYREIVVPLDALRRTIAWQRLHPPAVSAEAFDYAAEDRALAAAGLA